MRNFIVCILHQIISEKSYQKGRGGRNVMRMRNAYKILVGKPEGKRPFTRLWC
jgi:hypothetical protein